MTMPHTERLARLTLLALLFTGVVHLTIALFGLTPRDDTDSGSRRSGMAMHIDAQNGCEYLSVPGGGITPRLAPDGRQTGCVR